MRKVVSIISFKTTEEFEQWQLSFDKPPHLVKVQLIVMSASIMAKQGGTTEASIQFTIVVLYTKELLKGDLNE